MIAQVEGRIEANQVFWHRCWLNLKEPPYILSRKFFCRLVVHCQSGRDIEERYFLDGVGVVQTKAVRDSTAAIVPGYQEALVSELSHDLHLIESHSMKGIIAVVVAVSRL